MNDKDIKLEILESLLSQSNENVLANSIQQSASFLDTLVLDVVKEDSNKAELIKNIINLKSFLENSLVEYKIKKSIELKIESKKKEVDLKKEQMKSKEK